MATRSLGQLTLDLIARTGAFVKPLDQAGRLTAKFRKQVSANMIASGIIVANFVQGAGRELSMFVKDTVTAGVEISRLSRLANTSAQDFQRYAAGAQALGIEQGKLADIFKDTSDKVGDFLQTGGGALADFFENVAPQVGVTAEQFRNLSGPQALELYVSSLERANVSQNEMVFFLEAIASDSSALIPLLRNNAEGFKLFADEAERAGAIMSEDTVSSAEELAAAMFLIEQNTKGFKNQVAAGLLPVLSDVAIAFTDVAGTGTLAEDVGRGLGEIFKRLAQFAAGTAAAFQIVGKSIGALAAADQALDLDIEDRLFPPLAAKKLIENFGSVRDTFTAFSEDIGDVVERTALQIEAIGNAGQADADGVTRTDDRITKLAETLRMIKSEMSNGGTGIAKDQFDAQEQITKTIEGLELQVDLLGKTAEEAELYKLALAGASDDQLATAEAALEVLRLAKDTADQQEAYADLMRDIRTDEEKLADTLRERLSLLRDIGEAGQSERELVIRRTLEDGIDDSGPEIDGDKGFEAQRIQLQNWYADQLAMYQRFREQFAESGAFFDEQQAALQMEYQEHLTKIWTDGEHERKENLEQGYIALLDVAGKYYEGVEGEEAAYTRAAIQLGKTLLTEKGRQAFKSIVQSTNSAAMGAYEALASIPYVGPALGAAAAAAIYTAGGIAGAEVLGIAHDGLDRVPQTGTYLLEQGERVTTERTSARLDRTLDNVQRSMGSSSSGGQSIRVVNVFDANDVGNEYMSSSDAETNVMNIVKRNQRTIQTLASS